MIPTLEEMVRSATTSEANATDPETLRDIVDSFLAGEQNGTGGLYVRDTNLGGAIRGVVSRFGDRADRGHNRACRAEARKRRSGGRQNPADLLGRPGPARRLELRHDDAARAFARSRGEGRVHRRGSGGVRTAGSRPPGGDQQYRGP